MDADVTQRRAEARIARMRTRFQAFRDHAETMVTWAQSAQALAMDNGQLEEHTITLGYEAMRLLTDAHMALRTVAEPHRDDVVDADGDRRVTTECDQDHVRTMVYGPVTTSRISYRRHRKTNLYPADAQLNWAGVHSYSAGLTKRVAAASAVIPFAQAANQVSAAAAVTIGKRQAEHLAVSSAVDFEAFYEARLPQPCTPEHGLLITADGSAFTVRPEALRPATAKAARARAAAAGGWPDDPEQPRKAKKRSAELVCVADIPPVVRTAEDILTALFAPPRRDDGECPHPGPKAQGKTLFASVRDPIAAVVARGFAEAHRRDPDHVRPWLAVVDGNNAQIDAIQACAARYQVNVPILIDLIHVVQYLWKAAGSFFPTGDRAAKDWVKAQTGKILAGKARDVAAGIRRRASRTGLDPKAREGADAAATYLDNKRDFLDYPGFLAAGWPIASGLIEGACRWLIKDRMEVTGARWSLDGAEAVLRLRALVGNGDFDDYFTFHLQQEHHRNHDSHYQQPTHHHHNHTPPHNDRHHT